MMDRFGEHGWGMGMGWWWIIGFLMLIAIIWSVTQWINRRDNTTPKSGKSVLDILKERYARGEINKQEFEERKRDLEWKILRKI